MCVYSALLEDPDYDAKPVDNNFKMIAGEIIKEQAPFYYDYFINKFPKVDFYCKVDDPWVYVVEGQILLGIIKVPPKFHKNQQHIASHGII